MKGIKKCSSSVLLLGLFLISFFISCSGNAYAWGSGASGAAKSDPLPDCNYLVGNSGDTIPSNWATQVSALGQQATNTKTAYMWYGPQNGRRLLVVSPSPTYPNPKLEFYYDSTKNPGYPDQMYRWRAQGYIQRYTTPSNQVIAKDTGSPTVSVTDGTFDNTETAPTQVTYCLNKRVGGAYRNITFDSTYTNGTSYTSQDSLSTISNASNGCRALDFGCWIQTGWDTTSKNLLQGFTYLFSPDSDTVSNQFSDLGTFFSTKFGFLVYPITFMVDMFNSITAVTSADVYYTGTACTRPFPTVSIPGLSGSGFFGSNVSIDFCHIPFMEQLTFFMQIFVSVALIYLFKAKLQEVMTS